MLFSELCNKLLINEFYVRYCWMKNLCCTLYILIISSPSGTAVLLCQNVFN